MLNMNATRPMKLGVAIMISALVLTLLYPLLLAITAITNNVLIGYAAIAYSGLVLPVAAGLFLIGIVVFLAPVSRKNNAIEKPDAQSSL